LGKFLTPMCNVVLYKSYYIGLHAVCLGWLSLPPSVGR